MKIVFISGVAGSGKSTVCNYFKSNNMIPNYVIFDIDDLENVNEYNSDNYISFYDNAIRKAISLASGKDIVLASCINTNDIKSITILNEVAIKTILLTCSNEELIERLMNRDKERECSNQKFINSQIDYQNWLIANKDSFDYVVDNTNLEVEDVAFEIINHK